MHLESSRSTYHSMTIIYYHASANKYDFPSFVEIDQHSNEVRASKTALGYYVSTEFIGIKKEYNYEITLFKDTPTLRWAIGEMKDFHRSLEHLSLSDQYDRWKELRQIFGTLFGLIEIEELDGRVREAVIVNLEEIYSFRLASEKY